MTEPTDISSWMAPVERSVRRGATHAVALRRWYDAVPEEVWDAWTNPERTKRWIGEVTGDLREGGEFVLAMSETERATCRIVRCDPARRLVVTWDFPGEAPQSAVELVLREDRDGTELHLEHVGFETPRMSRSYGLGWEDYLHCLGSFLSDPASPSRVASWEEIEAVLDPIWRPLADSPEDDERWAGVELSDGRAALTASRVYDSPPDEVWQAITDPAGLAEWFTDVEVSGRAWTASWPSGQAHGTITECEPALRLITTWRWDHESVESTVRIDLEPDGEGGSVLRLEQTGADGDSARGYAAGWHAHLTGLDAHLRGHPHSEPDWDADFTLAAKAIRPRSGDEDLRRWVAQGPTGRGIRLSDDGRTMSIRRRFDAPVDDVWSACTTPERLRRWLAEPDGTLAVDGVVTLDMGGPGETATCTILRCEPPRRLRVRWQWPGEPERICDLRLTIDGDGTILDLDHEGCDTSELAAGYGEGWESGLWKLDRLLRGDQPYEPPWAEIKAVLGPLWRAQMHD